ncbi:glial fibrillary acidic protein-like [Cucumis melo var. makuwa]|uniref:Glial fibrillary acidic protein-like n=2 Tax=Cucumis melo TaxID=3656 RepID=A0A5A7TXA1_CUCMM|nr:glial fibrillary acidic protein-like [Cucumis melo var. makuwa]
MVDTHASEVVAQLIPNEDSWENVSQWSEHFQLKSGSSWPKKLEVPLPKTCQLGFINNNLEELKSLWESLMPEQRAEFTKAYGSICDLLYTTINTSTLQALSHFWDPVLKCFTFNTFDLTPTIEEYQALISLPVDRGNNLYIYDRKLTLQRSLSKFMGDIHASELKKQMKTKEGRNCIPINYLINLARGCLLRKNGLSLIALCIYGTVIFPRIKGYVEEEVVKIFVGIERGVNPVIPIMAETFRSLNHCRIQGKGKFFSCAPMLFIWISSHLRDLDEAKRKRLELEKENDSLNTEAIQVRKKNKRLLRNIANLHEEIEAKKTAMGIEVLQHSIEEYKSQLIEAESKNNFLQKAVNSSESQLLICRKARKVITDDYAQLIEKYQEMSIDFMMWKDEYETLRRKYDDAIGRMERGAEKLRQMARVADQFSVQARTLRQGVIPTRDTDKELSHFLGIIGQCLGRFRCYH